MTTGSASGAASIPGSPQKHLLIVEDHADLGQTLAQALESIHPEWSVKWVVCLKDAIQAVETPGASFDAAIVDLGLPDAKKVEAPLRIREADPDLAVIILTGENSDVTAEHLIRAGVQDYVVKGHATPNQLAKNVIAAIQRQTIQTQLREAAMQDPLTAVLNRHGLNATFERCLRMADRQNTIVAVVVCDLNLFKEINDKFGHPAGDKVLTTFAQALQNSIRPADIVARMGGDEFIVVLNGIDNIDGVAMAVERIVAELPDECLYNEDHIRFSASFGVAIYQKHGKTIEALIEAADAAMYKVKCLQSAYGIADI